MSQTQNNKTPVQTLDLTGLVCPMTFLKVKLHLEQMESGQVVEIILKEGEAMRDVPRSIKDEGHRIEEVHKEGDRYRLRVRKCT